MTDQPNRASVAGRVYLDLRKLARERKRPTAELLQLYALEGFLARLPLSKLANQFVLKGGVLLAAFEARRPTRDIDLAAIEISNDTETVRSALRGVLEVSLDDGLEFRSTELGSKTIRDGDNYSGVRVSVPCQLASAKVDFHVDVNVGDPIVPPPAVVEIPRLLGGAPIRIVGYSITMVLAEKIVTALQRGAANTRWRDFADIVVLSRAHELGARELLGSIVAVAEHRRIHLEPLRPNLDGFAEAAQQSWAAWVRRFQLKGQLPISFGDLLEEVFKLVDPLLSSEVSTGNWNPSSMTWE